MTDQPDLYKLLQVDSEADPDVIQAAYRRLAQKFHPDVAGGPESAERMVAINAAWEILGDPARRSLYDIEREQARDRTGSNGSRAAPAPAPARPAPPTAAPAVHRRRHAAARAGQQQLDIGPLERRRRL